MKILVIDDHPLIQDALSQVLPQLGEEVVVRSAASSAAGTQILHDKNEAARMSRPRKTARKACFLYLLCSLLLVPEAASAAPVPLYQGYASWLTDNFYTTNETEIKNAVAYYGYTAYGIAAWIESQNVAGTVPLYRLYGGSPYTEHYYTTSINDMSFVQSWGYWFEGIAGYVFSSYVPGTVPLYRYWWWTGTWPGDVAHYLTTSPTPPYGWGYDTVVGYVWASPPVAQYNAAFVSQNVSSTMPFQALTNVSVTMRNTGWQKWYGHDTAMFFATQSPQDNYYWCVQGGPPGPYGMPGGSRVYIPQDVAPGDSVTFNVGVMPGSCGSTPAVNQWLGWNFRMLGPPGAFGQSTPSVLVQIVGGSPPPPTGTTGARTGFHTVYPPGPPPPTTPVVIWPSHQQGRRPCAKLSLQ